MRVIDGIWICGIASLIRAADADAASLVSPLEPAANGGCGDGD
jgi:hypothetical protein